MRGRRHLLLAAVALLLPVTTVGPATAGVARVAVAGRAADGGASLADYARTRPGEVTAYVHDEVTGRDLILDAGASMITAGIVKASLLAQLLRQRHGRLSAREQTLATRMITKSDNKATNALWDDVGRAPADAPRTTR